MQHIEEEEERERESCELPGFSVLTLRQPVLRLQGDERIPPTGRLFGDDKGVGFVTVLLAV